MADTICTCNDSDCTGDCEAGLPRRRVPVDFANLKGPERIHEVLQMGRATATSRSDLEAARRFLGAGQTGRSQKPFIIRVYERIIQFIKCVLQGGA